MNAFVVRVWTPTEVAGVGDDTLRGLVEHVGSGRSTPFGNERELLAFLRSATLPESATGTDSGTSTSCG